MMNLGALNSGVDRPLGTPEESSRLYRLMMVVIEGATIANYLGDKAELEARMRYALDEFDRNFVQPSRTRPEAMLAAVATGELPGSELPRDVLTVLVRSVDEFSLPPDMVLRQTAFFLLSGAHTTATSFTRTMHRLLDHMDADPEDRERAYEDRGPRAAGGARSAATGTAESGAPPACPRPDGGGRRFGG